MINTTEIIRQLTNRELQSCFRDIKEWMRTGVLKEGSMVRVIHEDCEVKMNTEIDLRRIENEILYVIGERFSEIVFT